MYFDTHAHYDSGHFDADRDALLASMPGLGVDCIIDPGCDGESSRAALALAEKYPFVYAAVGWQPEEWESWDCGSEALVRELARHPKCVAIGEIGLDYYWDKEHKEIQYEMFVTQLELALELGKPVIIHDREAHEDCLRITGRYPGLRGVFHCFSGSVEMAREVLDFCPAERILVETDSPYLTPVPFRGKRNDSGKLRYIVEKIAEIKGLPPEEMARISSENARRLFGLN